MPIVRTSDANPAMFLTPRFTALDTKLRTEIDPQLVSRLARARMIFYARDPAHTHVDQFERRVGRYGIFRRVEHRVVGTFSRRVSLQDSNTDGAGESLSRLAGVHFLERGRGRPRHIATLPKIAFVRVVVETKAQIKILTSKFVGQWRERVGGGNSTPGCAVKDHVARRIRELHSGHAAIF